MSLFCAFSRLTSIFYFNPYNDIFPLVPPSRHQCQWVYRTFEDVEELERDRTADEKEESPFRPFPVENGSNRDENGTNGTGERRC